MVLLLLRNMFSRANNPTVMLQYCLVTLLMKESKMAAKIFEKQHQKYHTTYIFSECELTFTFAICRRPSVCLSVVCRL